MSQKIPTRVLSGFMELEPKEQLAFEKMKDTVRNVYERFGFIPLDTPVIERAEVLLAKAGGETEKQIYSFQKGDNELALRFDLTVPLARYVSEHFNNLAFPFRRYHIGKVYRGERPQKGRDREFYQCDIDIIGNDELSLVNDAEIPSVIYSAFKELDLGKFLIRVSNRKIINGLMEELSLAEKSVDIMRTIDKIDKVGAQAVREMLLEINVAESAVDKIFELLSLKGSNQDILSSLSAMQIESETFRHGVSELAEVVRNMQTLQIPQDYFIIDLKIARGLDYYTGTVYETILVDHPELGSICGGGRYDNLAEKFTSHNLPGVGMSIGLTRLFSQLLDAGLIKTGNATPTSVLVVPLTEDVAEPLRIATTLREAGIKTEIYLEEGKMKAKLGYADKLGVPFALIIGEDEIKSRKYALKNMKTGEQKLLAIEEVIVEVGS